MYFPLGLLHSKPANFSRSWCGEGSGEKEEEEEEGNLDREMLFSLFSFSFLIFIFAFFFFFFYSPLFFFFNPFESASCFNHFTLNKVKEKENETRERKKRETHKFCGEALSFSTKKRKKGGEREKRNGARLQIRNWLFHRRKRGKEGGEKTAKETRDKTAYFVFSSCSLLSRRVA